MQRFWNLVGLLGLVGLLAAANATFAHSEEPRVARVLTQQEQEALTPEEVSQLLRTGNQRFVSGTLTSRDHSAQVRDAAAGQFPKAIVLSCGDA